MSFAASVFGFKVSTKPSRMMGGRRRTPRAIVSRAADDGAGARVAKGKQNVKLDTKFSASPPLPLALDHCLLASGHPAVAALPLPDAAPTSTASSP
ncbi:Os11g0310333 [Oryza sativa Japonica Group]|uniref:Os11g0310333 protein n=1 Tax=Oryza sativa subsp. japonica TaxID=39947 RepID=A0A0P0Y1R3_ORYSJ|nr:Os11g0310333 [Oryza sativa Japonica Group]